MPKISKESSRYIFTDLHRLRISLAKKGQPSPMKGKKQSFESRYKARKSMILAMGAKTWSNWSWRRLRELAKSRDNWTCKKCKLREPEIMEVDHIIPSHIRPELFNQLSNLMTLCPNCHRRKTIKDRIKYRKND